MKKLLALVLALVMTLSLCVVSSNAAFDDAADIDYKEAVDVLSAVGVFVGDGTGKFYPDEQLTREQAAKLIAYLDLGNSVAEALPSIGTFSDVSSWANKYVDYLANAKIVNGIGDGKFGGANNVTGYEFSKMLLVVLGWDADIEGMTGSAWQIGVAKLVKEYKLAKGYSTNLSAPLTREAAAKLILNAIQAKYVDHYNYNGGFTIKENELSYQAKGNAVESANKFYQHHWTGNDTLTKVTSNNSFGAPYTKWTYQGKKVGTYTDEPVLTFTEKIRYSDLYTQILEAGYKFDTDKATDFTVDLTNYTNGYALASDTIASGDALKNYVHTQQNRKEWANYSGTSGDPIYTVNVYADGDGYVTDIAKVNYVLTEVTGKVEDKASTTLTDERELTFTGPYTDCDATEDPSGFDEVYAAVKAHDKVLVAVNGDPGRNNVIGVKLPTVVEGKITKSSATQLTINGESYTTYNSAAVAGTFSTTTTYKAWVDENGFVYDTTAVAAEGNVYGILGYTSLLTSDNEVVDAVKVIKADGTEATLEIARNANVGTAGSLVTLTENTTTKKYGTDTAAASVKTINSASVTKLAKRVSDTSGNNYALADGCKVIYVNQNSTDNTKGEYTVSSKLQALTTASPTVYAVINDDNKVTALFIGEAADTTVDDVKSLIYVSAANGTGSDVDTKGNSFTYYTYKAFIDGEFVEINSITASVSAGWYKTKTDSVKNDMYVLTATYTDTNEDYKCAANAALNKAAVDSDTFVAMTGIDLGITDETKIASAVEAIEATTYAQVKALLDTNEYASLDVVALYDKDTNNTVYLYIKSAT